MNDELIKVSQKDMDFMEALALNPPKPNEALQQALCKVGAKVEVSQKDMDFMEALTIDPPKPNEALQRAWAKVQEEGEQA